MQPSSTEKSSRTTLHYVILNDSARDLVLPPLSSLYEGETGAVYVLPGQSGIQVFITPTSGIQVFTI